MHDANQLHAQITTPCSLTNDEVTLKESSCLRRQERLLPSRRLPHDRRDLFKCSIVRCYIKLQEYCLTVGTCMYYPLHLQLDGRSQSIVA
jgi:hypothetical protein